MITNSKSASLIKFKDSHNNLFEPFNGVLKKMYKTTKNPLDATKSYWYTRFMVRRSSAVEQLTVNQLVVGSIPTAGAIKSNSYCFCMLQWPYDYLLKSIKISKFKALPFVRAAFTSGTSKNCSTLSQKYSGYLSLKRRNSSFACLKSQAFREYLIVLDIVFEKYVPSSNIGSQ